MDMLLRYKKPGGFTQLLSLIESFGGAKRDKFLEMIEAEDAGWAKAIREKFLSIERLFTWPDDAIAQVLKDLPVRNFACALQGFTPEQTAVAVKFMSHSERRKLDQELASTVAKPEDVAASFHRIIELARRAIHQGDVRLDKVDPALMIPDNFEEELSKGAALGTSGSSPAHGAPTSVQVDMASAAQVALKKKAEAGELDPKMAQEVLSLQKNLATVLKENKSLKDELKIARDKLEQIKRIA